MRIFHCITTLDRGGAETQLLMLARHQISVEGHALSIGYLQGAGEMRRAFEDAGADVACLGPRATAASVTRVLRFVRGRGFDVAHTHLLKANVLGGLAARLAGIPTVVAHKHSDDVHMKQVRVALIHDVVSRLSDDAVVYLSQNTADFFARHGVLPHPNRHVVHYGFDPDVYRQDGEDIRAELGLAAGAFLFVTLSRIVRQKGIDVLVAAFEEVARTLPFVHLAIAGGASMEPAYAAAIDRQIACSPARARIHRLGLRDAPGAVYHAGDAFVLASRWEGLGLVLLEAMFFGLPIIATRASAIPEIIRDGVDGQLVAADDPAALGAAMLAIARQGRRPHVANCARLAAFQPGKLYPRLTQIYRNPAAEPPPA